MPTTKHDVVTGHVVGSTDAPSGAPYIPSAGASAAHGLPPYVARTSAQTPPVLVPQRSVLLAGVLAFVFGPLGMLYSTIFGAFVTGFFALVGLIAGAGLGAVAAWPLCAIWAMWAAHRKNERAKALAAIFGRW